MGGQCISQSWQAAGDIVPGGIGSGGLTVMLKEEEEEGEVNRSEVQLLSTRDGKERGPTTFRSRHAQLAQPSRSQDRAW